MGLFLLNRVYYFFSFAGLCDDQSVTAGWILDSFNPLQEDYVPQLRKLKTAFRKYFYCAFSISVRGYNSISIWRSHNCNCEKYGLRREVYKHSHVSELHIASSPGSKIKTNKKSEDADRSTVFSLLISFMLGLPFHPEDGGDILRQKIGLFPNYTVLNPRMAYSS